MTKSRGLLALSSLSSDMYYALSVVVAIWFVAKESATKGYSLLRKWDCKIYSSWLEAETKGGKSALKSCRFNMKWFEEQAKQIHDVGARERGERETQLKARNTYHCSDLIKPIIPDFWSHPIIPVPLSELKIPDFWSYPTTVSLWLDWAWNPRLLVISYNSSSDMYYNF